MFFIDNKDSVFCINFLLLLLLLFVCWGVGGVVGKPVTTTQSPQ